MTFDDADIDNFLNRRTVVTEQITPRISMFDKSFSIPGKYYAYTKAGHKICYHQRTELWKDKTSCYFVTLKKADVYAFDDRFIGGHNDLDVRYNEISAVGELT